MRTAKFLKPIKHVRLFNVIIDTKTQKRTEYQSINEAKRASRKLQRTMDGALGRGTLAAP